MEPRKTKYLSVEQCVDLVIQEFGDVISIGMPLGLGKPAPLINALYQRAKQNPKIKLTIYTALSLEKPTWSSDLERRFLEPFVARTWKDVPNLDYLMDLRKGQLPANVIIHELFCKAGAYRKNPQMQQNYMSTNYTHTVRDCTINDNRIFAQLLAKSEGAGGTRYSTSCNADTSLEALRAFDGATKEGKQNLTIGMVNTQLPFMYGDAEVGAERYDVIIDDPQFYQPLFATPRLPVSVADFMIGLHISTLIKDGGTMQIGIGALGDAIAYGLNVRHNQNEVYKQLIQASGVGATYGALIDAIGGTGPFAQGLYGSTEMLVDGFLQLYKNGVIKRKVYHNAAIQCLVNEGKIKEERIPVDILRQMIDAELINPYLTRRDFESLQKYGIFKADLAYADGYLVKDGRRFSALLTDKQNLEAINEICLGDRLKKGVVLTGAFFIGPADFYEDLRRMSEEERRQFEMTGVDVANQLYGDEVLRALERKEGRFCNTGMKATLLGAIVSDGLDDGTVVSGVGGQYNFVSMAHALPDARLLMMIKSTRLEGGQTLSNIVYNYGHVTIPRHLRDIVVTEYGIADIRGKCDQDIIKEMLNITDSRFQEALLAEAKQYKKIPADYQIPERFRHNTPERLTEFLKPYKAQGLFQDFPCGSAFTDVELLLAYALRLMKAKAAGPGAAEIPAIIESLPAEVPAGLKPFFDRMDLTNAATPEALQSQKMLMLAFRMAGFF